MKTLAQRLSICLVVVALLGIPMAQADEVQDAVTELLAKDAGCVVIVEFDLKRTDDLGGREVSLQGALVGEDLVLVTSAKQLDPPVGGQFRKPEKIEVRFPGDVKRKAQFVGKDEELNLALLRLDPVEEEQADAPPAEDVPEGDAPADDDVPADDVPADDAPADDASADEASTQEDAADEGAQEPAKPAVYASFDFDGELVPAQPLLSLRRLGHADDDLVTFSQLRVTAVIPRPGLPMEYRTLGNLGAHEGCPVFSHDGVVVGYVVGSTQTGGRGGFRFVNGQLVRNESERSGFPRRILHAKHVRDFLADPGRGTWRDSWLGLKDLQALTKPLAEAYGIEKPGGIVIGAVGVKSPADRAGLKAADVIVSVDGERLDTLKDRDIASFKRTIRKAKAGSTMLFEVLRSGDDALATLELSALIEESPLTENEVPEYHDERFGLKLKPLTRDFLERSRLDIDLKGVRVVSIDSASWASIAGIQSGDVIRKMVLKPCDNLDQYKEIMGALLESRDSEVCYNVVRSRKSLFLCVRPDWSTVDPLIPAK